jgi:hypothetical protein
MAWGDATLIQVIRSVADTQPGYQVEVSDGVVHVFPQGLAADRGNFLNLKVKEFEARGELFAFVAIRLQDLVRQTVSPPPPPPPGAGEGSNVGSTPGEKLLTFRLRDVTVEKALDVIALVSDQRIWVVTFCSDCGLTPTGFRRTVALWRSGPLPDDLQPIFDAFRWGQEIPRVALNLN